MTAQFSPCRRYRYTLGRDAVVVGGVGTVVFLGLNPSIADESRDDPTTTRCLAFARRWGFARMEVLNLYAYCSTDPRALRRIDDPVGPDNDRAIAEGCAKADLLIAAWGAHRVDKRAAYVLELIGKGTHCLGLTKAGAPRHPLY